MTTLTQTIREYQKLLRAAARQQAQLDLKHQKFKLEMEHTRAQIRRITQQASDLRAIIHACVATGESVTEVKLKYTVDEMQQQTKLTESVMGNPDDLFFTIPISKSMIYTKASPSTGIATLPTTKTTTLSSLGVIGDSQP